MDKQAHDVAERWKRVRQVYFAALDVDEPERVELLHTLCSNDPALEQEVLRLLRLGDLAGDFLEQPAVVALAPLMTSSTQLVAPGDLLADRYRIINFIGRGGMGEVYEAHDEVIDHVVAVKVMHADLEPVEDLAARWRREVLLARKISHPGICRVHDVAIHRGGHRSLLLLTMERVNGESLSTLLGRGPLSLETGLAIALQLAKALDAAHAQGVLHRDVKPDNVLIDSKKGLETRAVLTDFGLARDITISDPMTHPGRVAGTAGYLAPELLRGEPPSISSDLFAFAVVVRALIDRGVPNLPRPLQNVFARALAPEPAARFGSGVAFVEALRRAVERPNRFWRRIGTMRIAIAVVLVGVALAFVPLRLYRGGSAAIAPASQVLLTGMVNGTNERDLDGVGEVLRSQLAQSPHFELLDPDRIRAVLTQMGRAHGDALSSEVAREIALREGVPLVVYGSLVQLGGEYAVSVKLEHVGPRPTFARDSWTQTFSTPTKPGIFEAVHDAAVWIRQMAGEVPSVLESQDRSASDTTTSSWEALQLLGQADALSAAGRSNEATLILEQAIRIDPDFAMAHMRLGDNLIGLRRDREGYAAWQRAITLAEHRQLTSRETLRIRGQYFDDTGDLLAAEKAYRTYAIHYPNDFYATFLLGGVLVDLDRVAEAVPWLEKAWSLRNRSIAGAVHLTLAYMDLGRQSDVERMLSNIRPLDAGWSVWLRALAELCAGKLEEALTSLDAPELQADPLWRSRTYTLRASLLSEGGREDEALRQLSLGIDFDLAQGLRDRAADKWLHVAELQRRNDDDKAQVSVRTALETALNARRVAIAVGILASMGHHAQANRLLTHFDDLPEVPTTIAARQKALGELLLASGDVSGAVKALEQWKRSARRRESRLALARALASAGDIRGAEKLLTDAAASPVAMYLGPEPQVPGPWRQIILELLTLVQQRDPASAEALRQKFGAMSIVTEQSSRR